MAEKAEIVISAKDQTGGAFGSATKNIQGAASQLTALGGRLAGIGAAIAVAAETFDRFNPKPVIDQADALNKLTQRTGIAVETLSSYQYAAKLADVSNEELDTSLKKLNLNIAAAARGEQEQAAAFKSIGVSVVDTSGKVRSADKVFEDIAARFARYEDGANKVDLANAVGGKSFEKLIPLLNGGKQGLQDAREELEKFGGVISGDLAKKAEQFNDNLTKLEQAGQKLKILIAGEMIDSLVSLTDRFVEAAKAGNLLEVALGALNDASAAGAGARFADDLFRNKTALEQAEESARHLNKVLDTTRANLAADPGNAGLQERLAKITAEANAANEALRGLRIGGGRGVVNPDLVKPPPEPEKEKAPGRPKSGAADDGQALLRKQLEGRIKAIQSALEREQDLFRFSDSKLQELYEHGELSIDAFYDAKAKAQLNFLVEQQKGFDAEIAALRAYEAKATKPQDREDAENRIADVLARQSKAYREAGQAAEVAEQQRSRAAESFRKSLAELDAQLAGLAGNQLGADLIRNAEQLKEIEKALGAGGGDAARVARAKELLEVQARLSEQQRQYSLITQQAANAEERLLLRAEQGGLSRDEVEKQLFAARQRSLQQLDELIAKQEILTQQAGPENKEAIQRLDDLRLARERAFAVVDPGLTRFNEQIRGTADLLANSVETSLIEGSDKGFRGLRQALLRNVLNDQFTKPLSDSINKALKDIGSGGTGGGFDKLFSGIGGAIGKFFSGGDGGINAAGANFSAGKDGAINALASVAEKGAAALSTSTDGLINSTDKASAAFGGIPAVLSQFATYIASLFSSSSSGDGGGLGGLIGSLFGGGSGSSAAGTSATDEALALFFHNGGVVGSGGMLRSIDRLAFAGGVPRYHNGGIAGLQPDERPAILRKGEEVLRADDPRHRSNGGGTGGGAPVVNINFTLNGPADRATQEQIARRTGQAVNRAVSRNS